MSFAKYPVSGGGGGISGPASSINNGLVLWSGTSGAALQDAGVGTNGQVLRTNGTAPSFGFVDNTNIAATFQLINNTTQSISGAKTFSDQMTLSASSSQLRFGPGTNHITLSVPTPSADLTYNLPNNVSDGLGNATFAMLEANQTFSGQQTVANNFFITSAGSLFIGTSPNRIQFSPGTQTTPSTWTFPNNGDSTFAALEGTQTFTGNKTFSGTLTIPASITVGANTLARSGAHNLTLTTSATTNATFPVGTVTLASLGSNTFTATQTISSGTNQINLSSGVNQLTLNSGTSAAARTYTVPDAGTTANFVMTEGTQTIGGTLTLPATVNYTSNGSIVKSGNHALTLTTTNTTNATIPSGTVTLAALSAQQTFSAINTFSNAIRLSNTVSQLSFGAADETTITCPTPAAARTYTIPDAGGNASFVMTSGAQTIGGNKSFTGDVAFDTSMLTLGPSVDRGLDSYHITFKNIMHGTPSTNSNTNGSWQVGSNTWTLAGREPTRLTGLSGGIIRFIPQTTDTADVVQVFTNLAADAASGTTATQKLGITADGAVTLGPSTFDGQHIINGRALFQTPSGTTTIAQFRENNANVPLFSISSTSTGIRLSSSFTTGISGRFEIFATGGSSTLVFGTNNTERGSISSTGVWTLGSSTVASGGSQFVTGGGEVTCAFRNNTTDAQPALLVSRATTENGGEIYIDFREAGTGATSATYGTSGGGIRRNSANTAYEIYSVSDAKLKDITGDMTGALAIVQGIGVKRYKWKRQDKRKETDTFGFIAQDVQALLPGSVGVGDDGMLNLGKSQMFDVLWQAVRELIEKVSELEKGQTQPPKGGPNA